MTVATYTTAPSLLPLYAKAALLGRRHHGDALPDAQATLADQVLDVDHLAAYQRLCGFRVTDVLPPTYLHVAAFPVTVALMTEPAFPFALIGLVHVANSISVVRPVRVSETVSFAVRTADLRPHPAGRQFDVVVEASVAGEVVWSGRSTYLRRGGAPARADEPSPGATPAPKGKPAAKGKPAPKAKAELPDGPLALVRVPGDLGRRYGALAGDRNPIHMYGLTAKAFGFPSAIAHGMWVKARTLATLEGRLPAAFTTEVAFKTPVFLPSTIAISTVRGGAGWTLDVRNARSAKPHLTGSVVPLD